MQNLIIKRIIKNKISKKTKYIIIIYLHKIAHYKI